MAVTLMLALMALSLLYSHHSIIQSSAHCSETSLCLLFLSPHPWQLLILTVLDFDFSRMSYWNPLDTAFLDRLWLGDMTHIDVPLSFLNFFLASVPHFYKCSPLLFSIFSPKAFMFASRLYQLWIKHLKFVYKFLSGHSFSAFCILSLFFE